MYLVRLVRKLFPSINSEISSLEIKLTKIHDIAELRGKSIENLQLELDLFKKRTEMLEDSKSDAFQVPLRQVKTIVQSQFSKLEMVIMQAGVMKIARESLDITDMEITVALAKKIAELLEKMPDSQELTPNPGKD